MATKKVDNNNWNSEKCNAERIHQQRIENESGKQQE